MANEQDGVPDLEPLGLRLSTLGDEVASFTALAPAALTSATDGIGGVETLGGIVIPIPSADDSLVLYGGITIPVP